MASDNLVVVICVVFFVGMGLVALARPNRVTSYFGLVDIPADFRNEVRAVYGGFGLAVALLLSIAQFGGQYREGILLSVAVALLGMAAGRILSLLMEKRMGTWPGVFLSAEILLASGLLWVLNASS